MAPRSKRRQRLVVGWREWVALPNLGIDRIKAKIDTGARTSAIHAWGVVVEERDEGLWVRFELHPIQRDNQTVVHCCAPIADIRNVKNSGGHIERRYIIKTDVQLGRRTWPIELSLTNRDEMGFRMLLGRAALRRRAVIDPGRSFLSDTAERDRSAQSAGRRRDVS